MGEVVGRALEGYYCRVKILAKCFLFAAAALAAVSVPPGTVAQSPDAPVAFVDVQVIPMDSERIVSNQTVLVVGDRIREIGPVEKVKVPAGAVKIEGDGKFLIPGLAEMHGHIPPPTSEASFIESVLFLYVANGVTTVRGMLGAPNQLDLRRRANAGELVSPTLYLAGPSFSGSSIESPAQAEQRVREQKAEGWDLLKVHPGLTRDEYDAMARTAKKVGIRFAGHVPSEVGLLRALEMGQETIDHLDGYIEFLNGAQGPVAEARLIDVAERTKLAGAWVVPTMVLWETLLGVPDIQTLRGFPELKYMPAPMVESWVQAHQRRTTAPQFNRAQAEQIAENRKRLLSVLNRRGVRILLGTDAPQQFSVPGFSIHREIRSMALAGMSPYEILQSGTKNVGEYFKDKDKFGTIEIGKRADLILLNGNPLGNISNIVNRAGVMVRGKWHSEGDTQERLRKIAAAASASGPR